MGHRVIGTIAYEHLNTETKNQIHAILAGLIDEDSPEQRFIEATVWADQIKQAGNHDFNTWHYISEPYAKDDVPTSPALADNILSALSKSLDVLNDPNQSQRVKAVYLAFLIHFVADAHQPLHAINYFSATTPTGDRGGNLYLIDDVTENLHRLWDQGLGLFGAYRIKNNLNYYQASDLAKVIQMHYPSSDFSLASDDLNPSSWVEESYFIARDFVYNIERGGNPHSDYITSGQIIVAQRVALAGYRLANVLNGLYQTN